MEEKGGEKKESSMHHPEHHSEHPEHITHHKKKLNIKRIALFAGILIVIIIAIFLSQKFFGTGKTQILTLDYKIYSGETVFEQKSDNFTKGSASSALGFASDKFDKEIASMKIGETKTVTLEAKDAYGAYDPTLVNEMNRTEKIERKTELNRTADISIDSFKQVFDEEPVVNKEYSLSGVVWKYKVLSIDIVNNKTKIQALANIGDKLASGIEGVDRIVVSVTSDKIITMLQGEKQLIPADYGNVELYFDNTYMYFKLNPFTDKEITVGEYKGYVTKLTEDKITIDGNHPFADKTVSVDVKLVAITESAAATSKKTIAGAPLMQVFIMSHCPYGTQIVKGLLPVWEKFQNKANIELRFVSYTMHGDQEELDNKRIICIREEQYSKLLAYLDCFVYGAGDEAGSQTCIAQTGVNKASLDSCVASKADAYMAEDKKLNTQYDVQGSPTIIIDGTEANIYPRDPQSVATALCAAFKTKPAECSQTFSTTNPSAGFGGGTGGTSGGSCG